MICWFFNHKHPQVNIPFQRKSQLLLVAVSPLSKLVVALKAVSVATGLLSRFTLQAGNIYRQCCFNVLEPRLLVYCVVTVKIPLILLSGTHKN
jgi:hypothetical protein